MTKRLALLAVLVVASLAACGKEHVKPASSGTPTTSEATTTTTEASTTTTSEAPTTTAP